MIWELIRRGAVIASQPGRQAITSIDDYLRAEQRDRTEPASFYVPGAEGWGDYKAKRRMARALDPLPDDEDAPADASLFDDPEALYDLTEGGYAASSLHPLED